MFYKQATINDGIRSVLFYQTQLVLLKKAKKRNSSCLQLCITGYNNKNQNFRFLPPGGENSKPKIYQNDVCIELNMQTKFHLFPTLTTEASFYLSIPSYITRLII